MTAISRTWPYATAAVALGLALPVLWGDVLLASHGANLLILAGSILP